LNTAYKAGICNAKSNRIQKVPFFGWGRYSRLNDRIQELSQDGWKVINAVPLTGFYGQVHGYALLIENEEI